jgi:hypothetical protein
MKRILSNYPRMKKEEIQILNDEFQHKALNDPNGVLKFNLI